MYVVAEHLFSVFGGSGILYSNVHERAIYHATPPLTCTQMCNLHEEGETRNGKALTPRERYALAQRWNGAQKRMPTEVTTPTTDAEGKARFIRMAVELYYMNGNRERLVASAKMVDAAILRAITWPAAARRGFNAMISRWTITEALGCSHSLGEEIEEFGDPAGKAYFAELARLSAEQTDRDIARYDARQATRVKAIRNEQPAQA